MAVLLLHVAGRISDLMVSMVAVMSLVTSFVSFLNSSKESKAAMWCLSKCAASHFLERFVRDSARVGRIDAAATESSSCQRGRDQ